MKELIAYYTKIGRHDVVASLNKVTSYNGYPNKPLHGHLVDSFGWKKSEMGFDYWKDLYSELVALDL